ncbi:recombinase family protein [Arthrobacter sp. Leaf337]|uniref:recombinase family protein n=1 Tax=Arthrobacter sp. Leaf337 TaxID=1736342 RepID=UPI0009E887F2|nr:recombinase family protein [Arthrobacter sp. Leaf337]
MPKTTHRIGYARISTRDQNLDLQRDALQKAGCDKIYKDAISGTKSQRPGLDQALDNPREGLNDRGVGFVSLTDAIDTTTVSGRFSFNVIASLAQMERELMVERTPAGLQAAPEQGQVGGRKRIMTASWRHRTSGQPSPSCRPAPPPP